MPPLSQCRTRVKSSLHSYNGMASWGFNRSQLSFSNARMSEPSRRSFASPSHYEAAWMRQRAHLLATFVLKSAKVN